MLRYTSRFVLRGYDSPLPAVCCVPNGLYFGGVIRVSSFPRKMTALTWRRGNRVIRGVPWM